MAKEEQYKTQAREALELAHTIESAELAVETARDLAEIRDVQIRSVAGYTETRDQLNRLIGQAAMARSLAKTADVASLLNLYEIKENKLYQTLKGKSGTDWKGEEIADVGTWDGFCRCLGLSRGKVDEDLRNLKALGEDALESLKRVGAGYRDIRQLRKLSPEDQAQVIAEAQATDDKQVLLDLIDELSAKYVKEKDALAKVKLMLDNERVEADKRKGDIADLQGRIAKLTDSQPPPDEVERAALVQIQKFHDGVSEIARSIQRILDERRLESATIRVRTATAHFCEHLELLGRKLFREVRYQDPNLWVEATPNENEIHEGRESEREAKEKLAAALSMLPLN